MIPVHTNHPPPEEIHKAPSPAKIYFQANLLSVSPQPALISNPTHLSHQRRTCESHLDPQDFPEKRDGVPPLRSSPPGSQSSTPMLHFSDHQHFETTISTPNNGSTANTRPHTLPTQPTHPRTHKSPWGSSAIPLTTTVGRLHGQLLHPRRLAATSSPREFQDGISGSPRDF